MSESEIRSPTVPNDPGSTWSGSKPIVADSGPVEVVVGVVVVVGATVTVVAGAVEVVVGSTAGQPWLLTT